MPLFRKKPVVVEARYFFNEASRHELLQWINEGQRAISQPEAWDLAASIMIPTLEGNHIASPGDWIIRGVKGEHYPCKPDIFLETYAQAIDVAEATSDQCSQKSWKHDGDLAFIVKYIVLCAQACEPPARLLGNARAGDIASAVSALIKERDELSEQITELIEQRARLQSTLGFFASVIKSGEPWSETCQKAYDEGIE